MVNHHTAMAEGNTAIHTARCLAAQCFLMRQAARLNFLPILNSFFGGTQSKLRTLVIHKPGRLTQYAFTSSNTFRVAAFRLWINQIQFRTDTAGCIRKNLLTNGINQRICYLRKELF